MVPVVGDAIGKGGKVVRAAAKHGDEIVEAGGKVAGEIGSKDISKAFSKSKQDLVEMAKNDKKAGGITSGDMQAYIDLNKELPDPFPSSKVRFDKNGHPNSKLPSSRNPHGHVGPVDHIPVVGD